MKIFVPTLVALASILSLAVDASTCTGPNARTEPPAGAIVVDGTGDPKYRGSYRTVKEGVAKLDVSSDKVQTIFVLPGVYTEQVVVPPLKGPLVLQGSTCDATSYAKNQVTITQAKSQKNVPFGPQDSNSQTSSVLFKSNNVKVYNLNIANTAGNVGQAVAVTVDATNCGFYGVSITGYEYTLQTRQGLQLYAKSYINGADDYIFGAEATAWFERCDIDSIGKGSITANGRSSDKSESSYVFNRAHVYSSNGLAPGSTFLGRPLRPFSRVVFQYSELSNVVNRTAWTTWNDEDTEDVFFGEFKNTGPGAALGRRATFSYQLKEAVGIKQVLGDNYESQWWVDTAYL